MSNVYKTISPEGLIELQEKSRNSKTKKKVLACKTIAIERFRHENYIRELPAHIVDEPPALLGDDSAPNPSEVLLAAWGTCVAVGIQANLVHRKINFRKIALELEGDIDISPVWGTGDTKDKFIGFSEVRVKVELDSELEPGEVDTFIKHVLTYSPVTGTIRNPVTVKYVQ